MARKTISEDLRALVAARAKGCCEYCLSQERFATHRFSVEHILSEIKGGLSELENLALACQGCNNFKYTYSNALDPETGLLATLYNPRTEVWHEHFRWNENFTVLIGISPTGRATIQRLKLNRDFLINQRVMYRAYGVHPPAI